ncbi:uncharacterized protein LOC144603182 [Rhinoraja longicauda]
MRVRTRVRSYSRTSPVWSTSPAAPRTCWPWRGTGGGLRERSQENEWGLTYDQRLAALGLCPLGFVNGLLGTAEGLDRVDAERMFPLVGESRTRGHSLSLKGCTFGKMWRNFFSRMAVNLWDSLPQTAVEAASQRISLWQR